MKNQCKTRIKTKTKKLERKLQQLDEEIAICREQIEKLCEQGQVDDGEAMMKQVEKLETEKKQLLLLDTNQIDPNARNKFTVCEICGVFQAVSDVMPFFSLFFFSVFPFFCFFCFVLCAFYLLT